MNNAITSTPSIADISNDGIFRFIETFENISKSWVFELKKKEKRGDSSVFYSERTHMTTIEIKLPWNIP